MSDDKPTPRVPDNRPDETQALPAADETQALPAADETQALPAADKTQALPAPDETQADATRAFPVAGPDDPLSVFDRPDLPAEPLPEPAHDPVPASLPAPDVPAPDVAAQTPAPIPSPGVPEQPHVSAGPRASTIVWGFLVVAFGVGLVANGAGAHIDVELGAILLLAAAGALLVIGSMVSAVRRRRRSSVG